MSAPGPTLAAGPERRWLTALADCAAVGCFVWGEVLLYANRALLDRLGLSWRQLAASGGGALLPPEPLEGPFRIAGRDLPARYALRLPASGEAAAGHEPDDRRETLTVILDRVELDGEAATLGIVLPPGDSGATAGEAWFRTLADTTSTAIFVYRHSLLYLNRASEKLTGYPSRDLIGRDPVELLHPDFQATAEELREARLAGEAAPEHYEMIIITRTGEERWIDFTAGSIEHLGAVAVLGTAVDITDRKRAELALEESEERLAIAQRAAGVVTWDWNLLTDELMISAGVAELTGRSSGEIPATSREFFELVVHPADHDRVMEAVQRAIQGGDDYEVEHRFRTDDDRLLWLGQRGRAIRDETGWVVRMVGVSIDLTERKQAELALRRSEKRLHLLVEQMPAILWTTDRGLVFTSSVGSGLRDLQLEPNEVVGMHLSEYLGDDRRTSASHKAHERALDGESVSFELSFAGNLYQCHVEPLAGADGEIAGVIGIAIDITERQRAEEALFQEQKRSDATLASIGDGVVRTNFAEQVDDINPIAEKLLGVTSAEARGRPLGEIYRVIEEGSRKPVETPVERCLVENRPVVLPGPRLLLTRDGREVVVRDSAAPIRDQKGDAVGAVLAFKDLTAVRAMERQMSYLVTHDRLTGLFNRSELERQLEWALAEDVEVDGETPAVMMLDIDQLKVINDTCGHLAGDQLLQRVAELLATQVQEDDVLARVGADEFALLMRSQAPAEARRTAESILALLRGFRFEWQDKAFELGVAIGLVTGGGDSPSAMMIAADTACLLAKESGRNRIHEYGSDDALLAERYDEMHWVHRIYRALDEDKLRLFCQPIQPLGDDIDKEEMLGEALLRMVGEDGELISPQSFVPTAERFRLIASIDRWVVRQSFRALAGWVSLGGRRVTRLAINLSGESLNDETFLSFIEQELEATGVEPWRILFEITETATIANLGGALPFINDLRNRGCRFVLDDFGSGLSSFAYLKDLPVDCLKIAAEFVRGACEPGIEQTLVRSFNQIGHDLGLTTIAEGIEDAATLELMRQLGLDYVQGYGIAPPQPLEYF